MFQKKVTASQHSLLTFSSPLRGAENYRQLGENSSGGARRFIGYFLSPNISGLVLMPFQPPGYSLVSCPPPWSHYILPWQILF